MEPAAVISPAIVKLNRAQRRVNAHADTNAVFNKAKVKIVFKTFIPGNAINGVSDVLSFDVGEVLLETEQGMLMIRGSELHVSRLTLEKGEVDIDGRIDSLTYSEQTASAGSKAESLLSRLFR